MQNNKKSTDNGRLKLTKQLAKQLVQIPKKIRLPSTNMQITNADLSGDRPAYKQIINNNPIFRQTMINYMTVSPAINQSQMEGSNQRGRNHIMSKIKLSRSNRERRQRSKALTCNKRQSIYEQTLNRNYHAQLSRSLSVTTSKLNYLHGIHNRLDFSKTESLWRCDSKSKDNKRDIKTQLKNMIYTRCKGNLTQKINQIIQHTQKQQINIKANSIVIEPHSFKCRRESRSGQRQGQGKTKKIVQKNKSHVIESLGSEEGVDPWESSSRARSKYQLSQHMLADKG